MMEQCLGCGLTLLLASIGATHFAPLTPFPHFSPPPFSSRLDGHGAHMRRRGRSTWPEDGLAAAEERGGKGEPVL